MSFDGLKNFFNQVGNLITKGDLVESARKLEIKMQKMQKKLINKQDKTQKLLTDASMKLGETKYQILNGEIYALLEVHKLARHELIGICADDSVILGENLNVKVPIINEIKQMQIKINDIVSATGVGGFVALGVLGNAGFFSSGLVASCVGAAAHVTGTLTTIGGGSYVLGVLGFGGSAFVAGAATVGGALFAPVAAVAIYKTRAKNDEFYEKVDTAYRKFYIEYEKANIAIEYQINYTIPKINELERVLQKLRPNITKLQKKILSELDTLKSIVSEYNNCKSEILYSYTAEELELNKLKMRDIKKIEKLKEKFGALKLESIERLKMSVLLSEEFFRHVKTIYEMEPLEIKKNKGRLIVNSNIEKKYNEAYEFSLSFSA